MNEQLRALFRQQPWMPGAYLDREGEQWILSPLGLWAHTPPGREPSAWMSWEFVYLWGPFTEADPEPDSEDDIKHGRLQRE